MEKSCAPSESPGMTPPYEAASEPYEDIVSELNRSIEYEVRLKAKKWG